MGEGEYIIQMLNYQFICFSLVVEEVGEEEEEYLGTNRRWQ